jgi:hypothetical protein
VPEELGTRKNCESQFLLGLNPRLDVFEGIVISPITPDPFTNSKEIYKMAILRTLDFEPMLEGRKYLLFLYANRNGSDVYFYWWAAGTL